MCAASFLPLPMLAGVGATVGHPICPPPAGVLPPHSLLSAPLTQPLDRPLGGMSCPGRHCITLSRLLLPRAGVTLTMKGLRFGFQGCCGVSVLGGMSQDCNGKVTIPPSIYKQHSILFFLLRHFLSSPLILPTVWPAVQREALYSLVCSSRGSLRCGLAGGGRTTRAQVRVSLMLQLSD